MGYRPTEFYFGYGMNNDDLAYDLLEERVPKQDRPWGQGHQCNMPRILVLRDIKEQPGTKKRK